MKIVTAASIIKDEKILTGRRGPNEKLAGFWGFPGGKLEYGESLQDCLKRELMEEFGILSKVTDVIAKSVYRYEHGEIKLVALSTEADLSNASLTVHDEIRWVNIDNLVNMKLAPADIPIAENCSD